MDIKRLLALTFFCKCILVFMCFSLLVMHYVVGKVWFEETATISDIKANLAAGASPNTYNEYGLTGLMVAATKCNPTLAQVLIAAGANINAVSLGKERAMNTALHFACYNGTSDQCLQVAKILIDNAANVRARNQDGSLPHHLLIMVDNIEVRTNMLRLLIKSGANINAQDKEGFTILHKVVEMKDLNGVKLMVDVFGSLIDYTVKTTKGYTPLDYAKVLGWTDIATVLLQAQQTKRVGEDGNIGARDNNGLTGLMTAVMRGDQKLVSDLLRQGADINAQSNDEYSNTPLHWAVLYGDFDTIQLLLHNRANRTKLNSQGNAPIHFIVRLDTPAKRIKAASFMFDVQDVANRRAIINTQNGNGDTLLHLAVKMHDKELVNYLITTLSGIIDISKKNNQGKTPRILAEELKFVDLLPSFDMLVEVQKFAHP